MKIGGIDVSEYEYVVYSCCACEDGPCQLLMAEGIRPVHCPMDGERMDLGWDRWVADNVGWDRWVADNVIVPEEVK